MPNPAIETRLFRITAIVLAGLWMAIASWVVLRTSTFGSPDEASNDFFIRHLARTGQLNVQSALTADQLTFFHPRSMVVRQQRLLPGSFLGFLQVGATVNRLFGDRAYRLLTPVLALAGLIALYVLFRQFWSRWWSLLGTVLVAVHPVFFQFQTLPAFHNGAWLSLLMISGLALKRHHHRPTWPRAVVLGLVYGAAIAVRPSEILWTGPLLAIVLLTQPRGWRRLLIVAALAGLMQVPWLVVGASLYNAPLASAYTPSIFPEAGMSGQAAFWRIFVPPGGWSWHWLSSAWWYLFLLVPAWSAMALASLFFYFREKFDNPYKAVKLSLVSLVIVFFLVYYGSWDLYPLEPASRIGTLASYARYWLPLYVAMGAGVVLFFRRLRSRPAVFLLTAFLLLSQAVTIIWQPSSGLLARFKQNDEVQTKRQLVRRSTPPDALLIAGQSDKYFLQDRLVAFQLPTDQAGWQQLRQIRLDRPVYLYVTPRQYRRTTVQADAQSVGLWIGPAIAVGDDELWPIDE